MTSRENDETAERERLIFGAGFAFGVMFTLLILGMVLSTVVNRAVTMATLTDSTVLVPVAAAIMFAFVSGVALYVFALRDSFGIPQPVFETEPGESEPAEK